MRKALFQDLIDPDTKKVKCHLCPYRCVIADGKQGQCKVRLNKDGILYSLIYNHHTSVGMDPIEKKPLYHFHPGTEILSFGTFGCNFSCRFCQNWEISQSAFKHELTRAITPDKAAELAHNYHSLGGAYTYNEPLINYEWIYDTAQRIHEQGLANVLVTNGYINEEPLEKLIPFIDAANIDVKSFNDSFYRRLCGGSIGPVLRTVEVMIKRGRHVELTMLIIPGENDSTDEFTDMVDWISSINRHIPLHLSRFFPQYQLQKQPTSLALLEKFRDIAVKKLDYVYIGNVWEKKENNTYCANRSCNAILIKRTGYRTVLVGLDHSRCTACGTENNIRV
ncbi:MAG: AmmeMemoRadiSam system radical SAM enzyme [Elusimicrobia bacterium]|nr:AmmeMemoRadiSam system radical SAM enzyme [Elusimicrobiota bacterium]MBD3412535.1 AmmeMemoRadiSam system radical SAM enzyme [Elusimicrobiota bacterium]